MKKFYSILSVFAIGAMMSAQQMPAFAGADFEDWSAFTGGLNKYGVKHAEQGVGRGVDGSASLHINNSDGKKNDYVFTANAPKGLPTKGEAISFQIKGTSNKSLSIMVHHGGGNSIFNLESLIDGSKDEVEIEASSKNGYTGTIDTQGKWVKVKLNLSGITDLNTAEGTQFFIVKLGKAGTFDLDLDNFVLHSTELSTAEHSYAKVDFIKNTIVRDNLFFSTDSEVKIFNTAGQLVKTAKVAKDGVLNLSSLPKGVYIVAGVVNGKSVSQKIVKE